MPWPAGEWPRGEVPPDIDLEPLLDAMFDPAGELTRAFAVVVVHRGRLVAERYTDVLEHFDGPDEPIGPNTPLLSWSMAKSMLHALVGMLVAEGRLDPVATARDYARFGLLYLRDGVWDERRLRSEGWVDTARTLQAVDPENGNGYGWQWWVRADDPPGVFWANAYENQSILVCPALDLIVVRLGKTEAARSPLVRRWRADVVDAFARIAG